MEDCECCCEITKEPIKPVVKEAGKKMLWEILVPTEKAWEDGVVKPIRTRYHRVWDDKVRAISGGLTILSPARGQWISPDNELYKEKMIPVRLICTEEEIQEIIDFTLEYYNQEAVLAYKISDSVILKNRKR